MRRPRRDLCWREKSKEAIATAPVAAAPAVATRPDSTGYPRSPLLHRISPPTPSLSSRPTSAPADGARAGKPTARCRDLQRKQHGATPPVQHLRGLTQLLDQVLGAGSRSSGAFGTRDADFWSVAAQVPPAQSGRPGARGGGLGRSGVARVPFGRRLSPGRARRVCQLGFGWRWSARGD